MGEMREWVVSVLGGQVFRTGWKDDPRGGKLLYADGYEREAAAQLVEKWVER